jgi:bifunctional enzyme CysN/CysC
MVSFISPYRAERQAVRNLFEAGEFIEIFVDTPLEECERRDTKGLYAKARRGALINFTGIDSAYEVPLSPEIHIRTVGTTPEACVEEILARIQDSSAKH